MGTVEEKKLKVNSLNWNGGKNKNWCDKFIKMYTGFNLHEHGLVVRNLITHEWSRWIVNEFISDELQWMRSWGH
jgi:hypothetical protein